MKKVAILLCALVGLSMGQVFAADLIWRSDLYATDDYWSSADNWRLGDAVTPAGAVPGSGDTAYVILDPAIVNSTVPNVGIVRIGINWGFGGTLNVNAGGSLSVNNLEVNWRSKRVCQYQWRYTDSWEWFCRCGWRRQQRLFDAQQRGAECERCVAHELLGHLQWVV